MREFLIVEDHDDLRDLYETLIRRKYDNSHIDHVANGRDALEKVKLLDYAVIIVDIDIPVVNGIEFYKGLKKDHPHLAEKTIFVSGHVYNSENQLILEDVRPHLAKPFKSEDFLKLISYAMSKVEELFLARHGKMCKRQRARIKAGEKCTVVPLTQPSDSFQPICCTTLNYSIDGLSIQHEKEWPQGTKYVRVFASPYNISAKKARMVWTRHIEGFFQSGIQWV